MAIKYELMSKVMKPPIHTRGRQVLSKGLKRMREELMSDLV